jgi:hypothetical protein
MIPNSELRQFFTLKIGSKRVGTTLAPMMFSDTSLKILKPVKARLLPNVSKKKKKMSKNFLLLSTTVARNGT